MASDANTGGHKTTAQDTAKKRRLRAHQRAEADLHAPPAKAHANHLIPQRDIEVDLADVDLVSLGTVLGGITDFKILRGSIASLNVTTSLEYAHLLTDLAGMSRGNLLVLDVYEVSRRDVFGDDPDEDAEDDDDA